MKKEDFLKVISEKDNDQEVNELIGEIEEHVFRYIKYGTRSNVFNLVEACYKIYGRKPSGLPLG